MKMPMTIIRIALVTAPRAVPSALVSRPIDPAICAPMSKPRPLGSSPIPLAQPINRSTWNATTARNASACAASVVPANQPTQPTNATALKITIVSRHPRRIGSTRPNKRVPPSSSTENTSPPTISISGWASVITPTTASTIEIHTVARLISVWVTGSPKSAGPGFSTCSLSIGGSMADRPPSFLT